MSFDYSAIVQYRNSVVKTSQKIKTEIWNNDSNKVTFLFIVAAILIALFTYYRFADRHFTLSASWQQSDNLKLKDQLNELTELNRKIQALLTLTGDLQLDAYFERKVKETGVQQIREEADLLLKCNKQFQYNEQFVLSCNKAMNSLVEQIRAQTKEQSQQL